MPTLVTFQGGLGNQLFQLVGALGEGRGRLFGDLSLYDSRVPGYAGVDGRQFEMEDVCANLGMDLVQLPVGRYGRHYRALVNRLARRGPILKFGGLGVVVGSCIESGIADSDGGRLWSALSETFGDRVTKLDGVQGVHVRFGDYRKLQNIYGQPDARYYTEALGRIADPDRDVFVFSDEEVAAVEWLSQSIPGYRFLPASSGDWSAVDVSQGSWSDMLRMAACDRLVVGNSTYSWWAAWMGLRIKSSSETFCAAPSRMTATELAPPGGCLGFEWRMSNE